jgi:hypothetical protein
MDLRIYNGVCLEEHSVDLERIPWGRVLRSDGGPLLQARIQGLDGVHVARVRGQVQDGAMQLSGIHAIGEGGDIARLARQVSVGLDLVQCIGWRNIPLIN